MASKSGKRYDPVRALRQQLHEARKPQEEKPYDWGDGAAEVMAKGWKIGDKYPPNPGGWGWQHNLEVDLCMDARRKAGRTDWCPEDRAMLSRRVWHRRWLQITGHCTCHGYWTFLDIKTGDLREHEADCPLLGRKVE